MGSPTEGRRVAGATGAGSREPLARRALPKIDAALDRDPRGRQARKLNEWNPLLAREAGGDPNMAESKRQRWAGRQSCPARMGDYVASLCGMEWPAWEQVAKFIESDKLGKK